MLIAIRKHNAEFDEMCDLKTLKQWARTGEVHPNDLIKEDGEWVPASQASVLRGFFAAAAWDVSEDVLWKPQLSQRAPEAKTETDSITEDKNRLSSLQQETTESRHIPITPKLDKAESHSGALKESTVQKEAPVQNTDFDHAAFEREYLRSKPPTLADNEEVSIIASEEMRHVSTATEKRNDKAIIEGTLNNESVRWNPDLDIKDQLGLKTGLL